MKAPIFHLKIISILLPLLIAAQPIVYADTVAASGDATTFDVETVSEADGKLQWHGVVKGTEIEGKYTHYPKPGFFRRNPAPVESWFKGTLKQ